MNTRIIQNQINDAYSFTNQFFTVKAEVHVEPYSPARFGNPLCPSVTNGHIITFNQAWIEAGRLDSDDIPFFLMHELRHVYQHDQIYAYQNGAEYFEKPEIIKKWEYEWQPDHYIKNLGDPESRWKNITQEIEMDANGYALALFYLKYMGKKWPPLIRVEEDQFNLSQERAQDYINNRPEIQRWLKGHLTATV